MMKHSSIVWLMLCLKCSRHQEPNSNEEWNTSNIKHTYITSKFNNSAAHICSSSSLGLVSTVYYCAGGRHSILPLNIYDTQVLNLSHLTLPVTVQSPVSAPPQLSQHMWSLRWQTQTDISWQCHNTWFFTSSSASAWQGARGGPTLWWSWQMTRMSPWAAPHPWGQLGSWLLRAGRNSPMHLPPPPSAAPAGPVSSLADISTIQVQLYSGSAETFIVFVWML